MRVGLVCPYDLSAPGGVQQIAIELAGELRKGGDQVVLVAAGATASLGPGIDETTIMAGRPIRVKANQSVVPLTVSPLSSGRVRRALTDVDVIHVHEPLIPLVGWFALLVDKPTVATFHADPPRWASSVYRRAPFLARRFRRTVITAVSTVAASPLPPAWGNVTIVPNGLDVASYQLPVGRVAHRVCFLGRDDPRKGLDVLLGAWPLVRRAVPTAELKVIGASRSTAMPGVEYLGRVSAGEKKRLLSSSQVYVAPNTGEESFGIVVAEAMAAGCAVVCSDLPAFREVVGDAARMVPVGDSAAVAAEVVALLSSPEEAGALGEQAVAAVRRFDWAIVASEYRRLYQAARS